MENELISRETGHEIVPLHLFIESMRDSGYKNAAYALAELIDNSIQAGAADVRLICRDVENLVQQRARKQISEIAVLDNGRGMNADTLRMALQFGNGTHWQDRDGMGRFGMGLPSSSLSQCRRVEVWSWQDGPENALYSYLDLDEIRSRRMTHVPTPRRGDIPTLWLNRSDAIGRSGTLVVWSKLDRCSWKTSNTILSHSEFLVGRMYRRFIDKKRVSIHIISFVGDAEVNVESRLALPNDPMYLMRNTSCPPWGPTQKTVPMFKPHGDDMVIGVKKDGHEYEVRVRFSVACNDARDGYNSGAEPHGKHASRNMGVSVMRADRELELQEGWLIGYDTRERWWGCEVDFPPALDEYFGVTNNKQSARVLADFAKESLEAIAASEGVKEDELGEKWQNENDLRFVALSVRRAIDSNLSAIRKLIKAHSEGSKKGSRHSGSDQDSPESRGTQAVAKRRELGFAGASDLQEDLPEEERYRDVEQALISDGVSLQQASELATAAVQNRLKFTFAHGDFEGQAFFAVRPKGGVILITLNTSHPAYDHLVALLEEDCDDSDIAALRSRLKKSLAGLKLLLEAWARYEDEQSSQLAKDKIADVRVDWGRFARDFLRES